MSYTITGVQGKYPAQATSPYRTGRTAFTEINNKGESFEIPQGATLPEIIALMYPGAKIKMITGHWGFLSRDNKDRSRELGLSDRYVFRGESSVPEFKMHSIRLLSFLTEWLKLKGFPVKFDDKKKVDMPDNEQIWEMLSDTHPKHRLIKENLNEIQFVLSNADIMRKTSIVRTVLWGWHVSSYSGKDAPDPAKFAPAITAFKKGVDKILKTKEFHKLFNELFQKASDPLDTNMGYPYYEGKVDKQGNPVTRIAFLARAKGLLAAAKRRTPGNLTWKAVLEEIDARFGEGPLAGFPLAVAVIRRLQPGDKPAHFFVRTQSGLKAAYDEYGHNSQRVAWMVPWVYNLLLTPFHCFVKAIRMLLPGMYHDGASRMNRLAMLKAAFAQGKLVMAEADYSNYDRFMPVNIISILTDYFVGKLPDSSYWRDAAMHLHEGAHLIWPDYASDGTSFGYVFTPGKLGLLSGVKLTSETGSFVNFIVNLQAYINAAKLTEDQAVAYVSMYADGSQVGKKWERFYIQSDDSLLIASSLNELYEQGNHFTSLLKAAGLKGSVMLGDRFLMRHMNGGRDTPVPSRVWQNTLSNETPPPDEVTFNVGFASRTDGLMGHKSVDPFSTGKTLPVTKVEHDFTNLMLSSLVRFMETSTSKPFDSIAMARYMIDIGKGRREESIKLDGARRKATLALAALEQSKAPDAESYLRQLLRDKHKPVAQLALAELQATDQFFAQKVNDISRREEKFFQYAADMIGIKPIRL